MNITVYCAATPGRSQSIERATRALAAWIADNGHTVVYGGSGIGLMGVLAGTALSHDGRVIGVEPRFFIEAGVAQLDVSELVEVDTMAERKARMIELGDAFIALPGGFGTLEEISEIMSRIRLRFDNAPCFLVNIDGFYDPMRALLENMLEQGFITQEEFDHIAFPETSEELIQMLEAL